MNDTLSPELRARLDAHLDAVERALTAGGSTRERRRGVVDDLESQILDMLAGKADAPTMPDLERVLTSLDPPAAYGVDAGARMAAVPRPGTSAKPRYSRAAIWGLGCILASFLGVGLMLMVGLYWAVTIKPSAVVVQTYAAQPARVETGGPASTAPDTEVVPLPLRYTSPQSSPVVTYKRLLSILICPGMVILPFVLAGTLLGWIGFFQIRASKGALRGTGMALFDGLVYPLLLVLLVPLLA